MPHPFNKTALDYAAQVDLLIARGMHVEDRNAAEFFLANLNYYRLEAYWLPFEASRNPHAFKPGTSFDRVLALYVFDRELRLLMLDALERVEVAVRARWAYVLAHAAGSHAHLDPGLHDRHRKHPENLARLQREVERARTQELFIKHHLEAYLEPLPPTWVVCEVMSFGALSQWYASISQNDIRRKISEAFELHHNQLESWLQHLSIVRNVCAHHSRLWNREFTVTPSTPKASLRHLVQSWQQSSRRLYNCFLIVLHFMDLIAPRHTWGSRLVEHLATLEAPGGLPAMGFPVNTDPHVLGVA